MMQNMIIGQYVPGLSVLHRLDPRSKLTVVFLFVFIIFLADSIAAYGFVGIFTVLAVFMSKLKFQYLYKGLKPIIWLVILTFFLHIFMTKEGAVVVDLGWLTIYEEGLRQGIFISLRFLFLIVMTTLLTLTTTPIEITDGMEYLLSPFKRLKLPVHEIALMMSISLRFIPTLMQETEKIIKAQTARGANFTSGPIKERVRSVIALLVPLFISAFKRAEDLAIAMEARGYRGGEGRTKLRELKWKLSDTAAVSAVLILGLYLSIQRFILG
jgi:energy-coupling factor transport system permease protein